MQRSITAIFAGTTSPSTMSHPPQEGPLRLSPDDADVLIPARQVGNEIDAAPAISVGDQPTRLDCLLHDNRRCRIQIDHVHRPSRQSLQIGAGFEKLDRLRSVLEQDGQVDVRPGTRYTRLGPEQPGSGDDPTACRGGP